MENRINACLRSEGATVLTNLKTGFDLTTQQIVSIIQERFSSLEMNISWIKWNGKLVIDNRNKRSLSTENLEEKKHNE